MTNMQETEKPWQVLSHKVAVDSRWVKVYEEHLLDDTGKELEYWRVERSDSVIVLVRQNGLFLMPRKQWRPGVGLRTLDFPGGRIDNDSPVSAAERAVRRELQFDDSATFSLKPLTKQQLLVDSSFSSQKAHGFVAELPADIKTDASTHSAEALLDQLQCMQCRVMLLEWLRERPDEASQRTQI
jgi:hypothetical protein